MVMVLGVGDCACMVCVDVSSSVDDGGDVGVGGVCWMRRLCWWWW